MASFGRKHPLLSGILVAAIFELSMMLAAVLMSLFAPSFFLTNGDFVFQGTIECFVALVGIGLVFWFKLGDCYNERGKGFFGGLFCGLYFIIYALLAMALSMLSQAMTNPNAQLEPGWKIAVYVLTMMLVGFTEETFFRGVVSNLFFEKHGKDPAGVWTAVISTGLIFGLMHLLNALGSDFEGVIVQVIAASFMGMSLTAVYYRCRNLWVLIFIHGFWDVLAALTSGVFEGGSLTADISGYDISQCITAVPFMIVTLVLLRPSKLRDIVSMHPENQLKEPDEKVKSSARSKIGCAVAVVLAVVIMSSLLTFAIYRSGGFEGIGAQPELLRLSHAGDWNGEAQFEYSSGEFTAQSEDYRMTIRSFPTNRSTYVHVSVVDQDGKVYFEQSYGGVNSTACELKLDSGKTYKVVLKYDYSACEAGTECSYSTTVVITEQ